MNKEKKIAEFQNATIATIKAIAAKNLENREIQFFGNTTRFNSKQITIAKDSNDFDEAIVFTTMLLNCFEEVIETTFSLIRLFSFSDLKSHLFNTIIIFFLNSDNFLIKKSSYLLILIYYF